MNKYEQLNKNIETVKGQIIDQIFEKEFTITKLDGSFVEIEIFSGQELSIFLATSSNCEAFGFMKISFDELQSQYLRETIKPLIEEFKTKQLQMDIQKKEAELKELKEQL